MNKKIISQKEYNRLEKIRDEKFDKLEKAFIEWSKLADKLNKEIADTEVEIDRFDKAYDRN